jgi:HAD superfamily hydrolase (TIGR01458 family)
MAPRRPPDILRKSHAHSEGKTRARQKRDLEQDLAETVDDADAPRGARKDRNARGKRAAESQLGSGGRRGFADALLIDLDGVVYRGEDRIAGAAEAVARLGSLPVPRLFVTNTTSRPREKLVEKLAAFGIDVPVDEILAPADVAAEWLGDQRMRKLLLLVPEARTRVFADFDKVSPARAAKNASVDAVVVGDLGRHWTFDLLNTAFRCLMREPKPALVALGMTRYWHAPDGLRLDTAPFVAALAHATGIEPVVMGKPSPAFFAAALKRLGAKPGRTAMVGDDIRADVAGAQGAGLKGILVRTGKFRPADLGLGITPDLVIDSIVDLPSILGRHSEGGGATK